MSSCVFSWTPIAVGRYGCQAESRAKQPVNPARLQLLPLPLLGHRWLSIASWLADWLARFNISHFLWRPSGKRWLPTSPS